MGGSVYGYTEHYITARYKSKKVYDIKYLYFDRNVRRKVELLTFEGFFQNTLYIFQPECQFLINQK